MTRCPDADDREQLQRGRARCCWYATIVKRLAQVGLELNLDKTRIVYSDALIAMIYRCCAGIQIALPHR